MAARGLTCRLAWLALCLLPWGAACRQADQPDALSAAELRLLLSLSPVGPPPPSLGNAVAEDDRAAALGRRLFFDEALGRGGRSCAGCHRPERYFAGGPQGRRDVPSVVGAAYFPFLGWDGAADSVWAQSLRPIEDPAEMGRPRTSVARHVAARHLCAYEAVFGPLPDLSDERRFPARASPLVPEGRAAWRSMSPLDRRIIDGIFANVGKALEAFQRRLTPQPAPFDRYVAAVARGDPAGGGHLSAAALRGLRIFLGVGQCVHCHHGPLLSDLQFHNLGVPEVGEADALGRAEGARRVKADPFRCGGEHSDEADCAELRYLNPAFADFVGAFRTPSLRNVARTAPYMHGGQLRDLSEVIAFYRSMPGQPARGHRDLLLRRVSRSLPVADLLAFLEALTGPPPPWAAPPADDAGCSERQRRCASVPRGGGMGISRPCM